MLYLVYIFKRLSISTDFYRFAFMYLDEVIFILPQSFAFSVSKVRLGF